MFIIFCQFGCQTLHDKMANPKSCEAQQEFLNKTPFYGFKIDDNSILNTLDGRYPCPKCCKSRKYFCYTCYVPVLELEGKLPFVKVPLKIDIIKHKHEIDGKSTAAHAAILAHEDIKVYTYPDIPNYENDNVVIIFPSQNAINVSQLVNKDAYENIIECQNEPLDEIPPGYNRSTLMKKIHKTRQHYSFENKVNALPITKAIFIDSTWNQSKGIYKDQRLRQIPCVVIQNRISQFWRHQKGSPRWYLATIEAIHQFLVEIHIHSWGVHMNYKGIVNCFSESCIEKLNLKYSSESTAYNGQYDNLLFFFKHMYDLIHMYYQHEDLYAYKRRLM